MAKSEGFDREPITLDKQGRITIPSRFRAALKLPPEQKYPLWIEAHPSIKDCKRFIISK